MKPDGNSKRLIVTGLWIAMWLFIAPAWLWAEDGTALEVGSFPQASQADVCRMAESR